MVYYTTHVSMMAEPSGSVFEQLKLSNILFLSYLISVGLLIGIAESFQDHIPLGTRRQIRVVTIQVEKHLNENRSSLYRL